MNEMMIRQISQNEEQKTVCQTVIDKVWQAHKMNEKIVWQTPQKNDRMVWQTQQWQDGLRHPTRWMPRMAHMGSHT